MRSEEEILGFLNECSQVSTFGMSNGPCPLKKREEKTCQDDCLYEQSMDFGVTPEELAQMKKNCCEDWAEHLGCCAECSFPSAIRWVLGDDVDGSANGQQKLIETLK